MLGRCCWRRADKIKWKNKVKSGDILRRVAEERSILSTNRRTEENGPLHDAMEGTPGFGRRNIQLIDGIKQKENNGH